MAQDDKVSASADEAVESAVLALAQMMASGGTLGDLRGLDDSHYEAIYAAGYAQYNAGRYEQAETVFKFLVAHNAYDRRFPLALGSVKQIQGQYEEAIGYYGLSSVMDLMDPVPIFHCAECLIALGRNDDALEALGFVIRNSTSAEQKSYRERAQALQGLLSTRESNS